MAAVVGIDLGTTFSAIAALNDRGQPYTLRNLDNEMLTPSAILLDPEGNRAVVGQVALDSALETPERVATLVKRSIGLPYYNRPVCGREFRPETLSAIILRKLIQDAERELGPISQAVITVPAYFDDTRRKATHDAGRIAGLDVLDILDEPTAAALAYSLQPPPGHAARGPAVMPETPSNILVYDLGGGTFDVTVVRLGKNRFQTLAIEGDVRLGGKDWDDRIVQHVAQAFQQAHGSDPREDPQSLAALQAAAERAKRNLSRLPQTTVTCTHNGQKLTVPLTRTEFEAMTLDLLTRTRLTTQAVLRQAGLGWDQLERALLVGGSTHMPMCARMLSEVSGKPADHSLAVSEVVARGAALHAGITAARRGTQQDVDADVLDQLEQVVEINVNSHSLGVEVRRNEERVNDVLIPKNTQLPAAASRVYRTVADNQSRVRVRVLQGDATQADACISIGECWIDDLPPTLPKGSPVQVRCGCAANGLVDVMALDMTSGRLARAVIHRSSGLSDEEVASEAAWLRALTIE